MIERTQASLQGASLPGRSVQSGGEQAEADDGGPVILQVLPRLGTGGAERGAVDVAQAIVAAGGRAIVASEGGPLERELARAGAHHVTLPLASKNPLVMRRNVGRLEALIAQHDVDIVHARSRAPAWSAAAAARRGGRHFVTTFHGTYNASTPFKRRYNAIMVSGERVIAISEFIARHIRESYAVEPARIRIIQRGVDLARFDPARVSAERVIKLANAWRLPDGVPLLMLPGRLTRWKGQLLLLDALASLANVDFRCVLVGPDEGRGRYRVELEDAIVRHGLAERAFIVDDCDDMPAAYKLSDVVVSASTDPEGFGRVISEAQAMGCPVVASEHGGAPEQVLPGRTAFLFPPGDRTALADALRTALGLDSAARERLAVEAMVNARTNFSKERMCERTLALYSELLRADAYGQIDAAAG
jgi:glycosyltransferase involved in cell wall biosynthesis